MKLTQKRLKELLVYDSLLGVFSWRVYRNGRIKVGGIAGTLHSNGYRRIMLDNQQHGEHRLAWFYVHGYTPEHVVHHVNHVRHDNRICNLEHRSKLCNSQSKNSNTSGVVGVSWDKQRKKWKAQIKIKGKSNHLGLFDTIEDAAEARRVAYEEAYLTPQCDIND